MLPGFIEKYLSVEKKLNKIFSLTNYCVENCIPKSPRGCCEMNFFIYDEIATSDNYNLFNTLRQYIYGIPEKKSNVCSYFEDNKGCKLKSFKTTLCLSFICKSFKKYLFEEYDINYDFKEVSYFLDNIIKEKTTDKEFEDFNTKIDDWIKKIKEKVK